MYREFKQIAEYRISDGRCLGEPNVEIIYADDGGSAAATSAFAAGLTESFELISLSYLNKGIDLRSLSGCCSEFDKITRSLRERVSKVSSELHETNVHVQKELHEYMTQCQTIDQHVSGFSAYFIEFCCYEYAENTSSNFALHFSSSQTIISTFCHVMAISGYEISIITF